MLRRASGRPDGTVDPAVAARCAACHDPLGLACQVGDPADRIALADANPSQRGIGCETCHGPASHWLHLHYQVGIERTALRSAGMIDTKDLLTCARLCSTCHVGSPQHDLDHDLLAVGHPPLRFELTTFHAAIRNPHWDEVARRREEPMYEARLWAAGRLAATEASLDLLAHRARNAALIQKEKDENDDGKKVFAAPWPAWAEHNCWTCHQSLRPATVRAAEAGTPRQRVTAPSARDFRRGGIPVQHWNRALGPELVTTLARRDPSAATAFVTAYESLVYAMEGEWTPDPDEIARQAQASRAALAASEAHFAEATRSGNRPEDADFTVLDLLHVVGRALTVHVDDASRTNHATVAEGKTAASRPETDWEQACHVLLALAAARRTLIDAATVAQHSVPEQHAAETAFLIPEEVQHAPPLRRAAAILRMGPYPAWTAVLDASEGRAVGRAPVLEADTSEELWSQLAALHQALLAAARRLPASPHPREVRP